MYDLSSIIDNETLRRFYPIRPPKGFPTISSKGDTADQPWGKFNHSHPRTICAYSRVKKVSLAEHFKQRHSSLLTRQPSNIHFISALVLLFFFLLMVPSLLFFCVCCHKVFLMLPPQETILHLHLQRRLTYFIINHIHCHIFRVFFFRPLYLPFPLLLAFMGKKY